MKRTMKFLFALILVAVCLPSLSKAEDQDGGDSKWKYWVGGGGWFFEADDPSESGQLYEARVSYDVNDKVTTEAGIGGGPFFEGNDYPAPSPKEGTFNGNNSPGENWMVKPNVGVLYHLKGDSDSKWDPYVSVNGGVAYFGKRREGNNMAPFGGPGAGVAYKVNKDLAVRADYNMYVTEDSDVEINHSALLMAYYRFNGASSGSSTETTDAAEGTLGQTSSTPLKTIYFDFDKSVITKDSAQRLKENASWIRNNPDKKISLEGHCDERGTKEYNMALGERRAAAARKYLKNLGVNVDQVTTTSYGEEFPVDPGHNEAAWAKNRRVESIVKK